MSARSRPNRRLAVAENVRAELARQGVTQYDIGQLLGVSKSAMSRRIVGNTPFLDKELHQIADYLRIPVESLFKGAPQKVRVRRYETSETAQLIRQLADTADKTTQLMRKLADTIESGERRWEE
jgi:predicted transcriptional regulator